MQLILPEILASGIWKLESPFNNLLNDKTWYTCIAVRKIDDYTARHEDPYTDFYAKYNIDKNKFEEDANAGGCIITVIDNSGDLKSFPSAYLKSFPAGGGVAYQSLAIAIELGAVPETMNLDLLKSNIKSIVKDLVGVDKEPKLVNLAPRQLIDRDSSKRIEATRELNKEKFFSPLAKVKALEHENTELRKRLEVAERWIVDRLKKDSN